MPLAPQLPHLPSVLPPPLHCNCCVLLLLLLLPFSGDNFDILVILDMNLRQTSQAITPYLRASGAALILTGVAQTAHAMGETEIGRKTLII